MTFLSDTITDYLEECVNFTLLSTSTTSSSTSSSIHQSTMALFSLRVTNTFTISGVKLHLLLVNMLPLQLKTLIYPSWNIHHCQHDIYIQCQFSHAIPYMPSHIIPCHLSCHIHHGISIITKMLYIPFHISYVKPFIPCTSILCQISHAIWRAFSLVTYPPLPT
jgi:hypothetical protein